jgi:hypothetical protein
VQIRPFARKVSKGGPALVRKAQFASAYMVAVQGETTLSSCYSGNFFGGIKKVDDFCI